MKPLWDASLSLNSVDIDAEHQAIFASLDLVLAALAAGDASRAMATLDEAGKRFRQNFETEERLMQGAAHPRAIEHLEGHELFWKDFQDLRLQLERRGVVPVIALWVQSRMVQWFRFHIGTHDGPLVRRVNRAPPAPPPPAPEAALAEEPAKQSA